MQLPIVVKTLLLLNIAAYILDMLAPALLGHDLSALLGLYYVLHPLFHIWQPLTYMFMHAGLWHLFFNMFALWMFGRIMEQTWGPKRFLIYYLVCGFGAAFVQEAGQMLGFISPYAQTIGASGAVYGILLAFGMIYPEERLFIIPIPFPIKAKWFVTIYIVIELMEGLSASDGVAHFAHLGGMFFGALLILHWRKQAAAIHSSNDSRGFWTRKGGTRMHIHFGNRNNDGGSSYNRNEHSTAQTSHSADYEYNARKQQRAAEIDRILDKVRQGGYQSLTTEEKQTLFDASQKN